MPPIHGALKLNVSKCKCGNELNNIHISKSKHIDFIVHRTPPLHSKDVSLPTALQRAMAAEAEASREARAKVIAAEGEMKSSRALKEASDIMCESPAALQLRYLQTLNSIASEKNSTIIFPLPIDLIKGFMGNGNSS